MTTQDIRKWVIFHYDYNPSTGLFTNRISGLPASQKNEKGYIKIEIRGKRYYAHRLAHLIMEGEWPVQIDHRNRIRDDNRWENLLNADQFINAQNHSIRVTNTSGVSGVSFMGKKKWVAELTRNGKRKRVQSLNTKEEAISARRDLECQFASGEW